MKSKTILIIVLVIFLAGIGILCAITLISSYVFLNRVPGGIRMGGIANVSAQVQESRIYEVTTPATLEVFSDAGSITVTAANVENIEVELTRTAWAATEEKALAVAEALPVSFNQVGSKLTIRYERVGGIILGGSREGPDSVDFIIRVPNETAVVLEASFGKISLTGTTGNAELSGSFGDLSVADLTGALTINGSQSAISVQNVNSGSESVTLDTSFGEIEVNGLEGGRMLIRTSNGTITINDLSSSGDVEIQDQFGNITLEQFTAGTVTINSSSGQVKVNAGTLDEILDITNTFGSVMVRETKAATYDLETSNGELNLDGTDGSLTLTNNFGDILITQAKNAVLNVRSTNGRISFSGSLDPTFDQYIENSFGDILLIIPANSTFDIKFETQFGDINSDLPVTVSGSVSQTSLEGALNGGGSLLQAITSNGDITLKDLTGK